MTQSDYRKVLKQLKGKPGKLAKFNKHNTPKERSCGVQNKKCRITGRAGRGVISKYGLKVCRQSFREIATKIGFKKYS